MPRTKSVPAGRRKRWLWRMAFVLALLLTTTSASAAPQHLTGTFTGLILGKTVKFVRHGSQKTGTAGVLRLQLDSGPVLPVFCIQVDVAVQVNDRYRDDGPIDPRPNDPIQGACHVRYLLDRYPASTATTPDEAAARQLAIWYFTDGVDPTTITNDTPLVRDRAIALVNEASNAPCPPTQAVVPELTLNPPIAVVPAGQAIDYTVRAAPATAGQMVTVAVSGTATLDNGQQQMALPLDAQGIATFRVVSPVEGNSNVTAVLPYVLDPGTVFSHLDVNVPTQRLVLGERVNLNASTTVLATWGPPAPTATPQLTGTPAATDTPAPTSPPGSTVTATTPPGSTVTTTPPPGSTATATPPPGSTATATPSSATPTVPAPTVRPPHSTPVPAPPTTPTDQSPAGPQGPASPPGPATPPTDVTGQTPGPATEAVSGTLGLESGTPGPAGGAVIPRSLPRTGAPGGLASAVGLGVATLLLAGGWLLRRRAARR